MKKNRVSHVALNFLKVMSLMLISAMASATDFIEITVDPQGSGSSQADEVTFLLNRTNITHVQIDFTKTPERIWYKLIFHSKNKTVESGQSVLFKLECNKSEIVKTISSAIRNGDKKPINAFEWCHLIDN